MEVSEAGTAENATVAAARGEGHLEEEEATVATTEAGGNGGYEEEDDCGGGDADAVVRLTPSLLAAASSSSSSSSSPSSGDLMIPKKSSSGVYPTMAAGEEAEVGGSVVPPNADDDGPDPSEGVDDEAGEEKKDDAAGMMVSSPPPSASASPTEGDDGEGDVMMSEEGGTGGAVGPMMDSDGAEISSTSLPRAAADDVAVGTEGGDDDPEEEVAGSGVGVVVGIGGETGSNNDGGDDGGRWPRDPEEGDGFPGETKEEADRSEDVSEVAKPSVPSETLTVGGGSGDDEGPGREENGDETKSKEDGASAGAAAPTTVGTDPTDAGNDDDDAPSASDDDSSSESDDSSSDSDDDSSSEDEEEKGDLPESPSHEGLSAYELLRLRKMARNRARLAKLGLVSGIVGSSFGATTTATTITANGTAATTTPSSSMVAEEGGVGVGPTTWVCTRVSCGRENPTSKMRCLYCHGWRNGVRNPAVSSAAASSRRSEERRIVERRQLPARRSKGVSLLGNERRAGGRQETVELAGGRKSRSRVQRCHSCDGCVREDCGVCQMCLDKPRFGGSYRLRQACERRVCRRMIAWRDRNDVKKFYLRRKVGDTVQTPYGVGTVLRVVGEEEEEEDEDDGPEMEVEDEGKATATTAGRAAESEIDADAGVTSHPDSVTSHPGDGDAAMTKTTSATPESPAEATTEKDGDNSGGDSTKGMDAQLQSPDTGLGTGMTPIASDGSSTMDAVTANAATVALDPMNLSKISMTTESNTAPMASTTPEGTPDASCLAATAGMSSAAPVLQPNSWEVNGSTIAAVAIKSVPVTERIESKEMAVADLQIGPVTSQQIPQTTEEGASSMNTCVADAMEEATGEAHVSTKKTITEEPTIAPTQPTAMKRTDAKGPDRMLTTSPATAMATPTLAGKSETRKKKSRRTSMEISITSWTMSGGSHPTLYVPPIPRPEERPKATPVVSFVHTSGGSFSRVQDQPTNTRDGAIVPTLPADSVGPSWICSHPSCRAENPDNRKRCVSCLGWRGGVRWDLIGHRLVEGTEVRTLYGRGKILAVGTAMESPPVNGTREKKTDGSIDDDADLVKKESNAEHGGEDGQQQTSPPSAKSSMAVSLTSWTLADGSNPTLYLPCRDAIENSIMLEGRASRSSLSMDDIGGPTWTCCNPDCRQEMPMSKKRCWSCQGWRGGTRDMRTWASLCANCGMDGAQVRCKKCDQAFHLTCHDPPLNNGLPRGSWKCGDCKKTPYSSHGNCSVCSGDGDVVRCKRCDKLYHLWCHFPPLESVPRGCWKCTACKKALGAFKSGRAADDTCSVCGEVGEGGDLVCCKVCNKGFHRACHDPPLNGVHRGKWKCETCKHLPPPKKARAPAPRNIPPPENIHNADDCYVCFNGGELICCDYCDKSFHLECHIPALPEVPRGRWKCMECYASSRQKKSRCGECKACLREDCGKCVFCRDKSKFGGPNKLKKPCEKRVCQYQNFAAMAPVATPASAGKLTSETKKRPRHLSVPQAMPVSPPAKKRKRRSAPKPAAEAETSSHAGTSIDDTGEDAPIDVPKPGYACYSFELYSTLDNETPEMIAPKLGCTWQEIVAENRERYGFFKLHSRFEEGTILRIPVNHDQEKIAKIAEMGPQTDGKVEICRECGVLEVEAEGGVSMLSCEMCGGSCHLACAHDKPSEVSKGSWFCQCCAVPKLRVKMSSDETGALIASIIAPDLSIDEDSGNSDDEIRYEAVPEPGFVCSDAIFYCTLKNDTAERIAPKLGCTFEELASENMDRYGKFSLVSRFKEGTLLRIPSSHDKGKVEVLKRREDRIDVCCECGVEEGQQGPSESPMLLCDGCDAACHLACTPDHLSTVPEGEWFCRSCTTPKIRVHVQSGRGGKITATIITTCTDDDNNDVHDLENVPVDDMPDPGFVCPDAIFYSTRNNDTPELLAPKFGCSWRDLVSENNQYGNVRRKSKFKERTLLRIPSSHDREKLEKLKQREIGEDYMEVDNEYDDGNFSICKRKRGRPPKRKRGRPRKVDKIKVDKGADNCALRPSKRMRSSPRRQGNVEVDEGASECNSPTKMSGGSHPTLYVPPIPFPQERPKVTPVVSFVLSSRSSFGRGQDQRTKIQNGIVAPTLTADKVGPTWICSHPSCRAENPDNRKRCVSCLGWRGGVRWDLIGHRLVEGAEVRTLYGSGKILAVGTAMDSPPVNSTVEKKTEGSIDDDDADLVKNESDAGHVGEDGQKQISPPSAISSMAVSLTSWALADGSNPTLYLPCRDAIENSIMLEGRASQRSLTEADIGGPRWTCCNPTCQQENPMSKKRCGTCQGWRGGTRDIRTWASLCAICGFEGAQVRCKKCDQSFHLTCHDPPLNNGIPRGSWKCRDCKKTPHSSQGNCSVCSDDGDVVRCKRCNKFYHLWCHSPPLESIPRGNWKCTTCKNALSAFKFGRAADDTCSVCGEVGEGGDLVCCKVCNIGFHRACHDPPLIGVHRGKWKCETCKHLPSPKKVRAPRNVLPPENMHNADDCYVCSNGGELICCDYCNKSFHLECHIPALPEVPPGRWKCMECSRKKDKIEVDKKVDDFNLRSTKSLQSSPRRQNNGKVDEGVGDCNL